VVFRWGDGSEREEERLELGWVRWIMGTVYMVVGQQKLGIQGEGGSSGGTSMMPVMGDENEEGDAMECGRFWRGVGEEAKRLHSTEGGQRSEERLGGRGGQR
jgi:hypothetical protein